MYNYRMEFPWTCDCGRETVVDHEKLETRRIGLYTVYVFFCERCKQWKPVWFEEVSLSDAMRKLEAMKPSRKDFRFRFAKTLRRAVDIQKRGLTAWQGQNLSPGSR